MNMPPCQATLRPGARRPGGLVPTLLMLSLGACTTVEHSTLVPAESTLLLVSMEDGTLIRQEIAIDADVCMKTISAPDTICYQRGDAIMQGDQIIAWEMQRTDIQLYGE